MLAPENLLCKYSLSLHSRRCHQSDRDCHSTFQYLLSKDERKHYDEYKDDDDDDDVEDDDDNDDNDDDDDDDDDDDNFYELLMENKKGLFEG